MTASTFAGIYEIPEAARYLAVTTPPPNGLVIASTRLRYWIRSGTSRFDQPVFPTRHRLITFRDLVTMRLVAVLLAQGVGLKEVRDTETWLRNELQIPWPFVTRPLWTHSSDVFIKFEERLVAASRFGQQAMAFIEDWLKKVDVDMTFDSDDMASSWSPHDSVRLDPAIQFGEPCIDGTRIPTRAIWSKIKAGDSLDLVAGLYNVSRVAIKQAVSWEERLVSA